MPVRLTGEYASGDGYVDRLGEPGEMYAQVGHAHVALAGDGSYASGPDLAALPDPPPRTRFNARFSQAPTLLINGVIAALTCHRIKGVICYQDEGNVGRAAQYRSLFSALIDDWRRKWGYGRRQVRLRPGAGASSRCHCFDRRHASPVAVCYDCGNTPDGNLSNNDGLPAAPFRTDAASRVIDAR